ncbi:MAG TPA: hypothetical protein VF933_28090 [Streptosporangiaceae bacterium]
MGSQHRLKPRAFRPEPQEYAAAKADLEARGRQMDAFLRACLRRLRRDPDRFLDLLAPVWPRPKPQGRPGHRRPASASRERAAKTAVPAAIEANEEPAELRSHGGEPPSVI